MAARIEFKDQVDAMFEDTSVLRDNGAGLQAVLARELALETDNSVVLLLVQVQAIDPDSTCEALLEYLLKENKQVQTLPVVREGKPLGIVTRYDVVDRFSRLYFRELYGKKSIVEIMNEHPLVVEQDVTIEELGRIVSREGNPFLSDGFVITKDGFYLGMGNGQALVRELTNRKQAHLEDALGRASAKLLSAQQDLLVKERMQRELAIAQEIQTALLPKRKPDIPGYSVATLYRPAQEVGGDYYDFLPMAGGLTGFTVGDVAGKGVPGSLGMAMARTVLRTQIDPMRGPAETLRRTNGILLPDMRNGMFITLYYAILDPRNGRLTCACGGHNAAYHLGSRHGRRAVAPEGMALGLGPAASYFVTEEGVDLEPGDLFVLYTDGITEAMNPAEEEFGEARLLASLARHSAADLDRLPEALMSDLEAFTRGAPQSDDITLVALRRNR